MKVFIVENPRKDFKPITIQCTVDTELELNTLKDIFRLNQSIPTGVRSMGGSYSVAETIVAQFYSKLSDL